MLVRLDCFCFRAPLMQYRVGWYREGSGADVRSVFAGSSAVALDRQCRYRTISLIN